MNFSIFDLEQDILSCWNITGDLKLLEEAILEKDYSRDEIANVVLGLRVLYEMRFEKAWSSFEETCKEYHRRGNQNASTD